MVPNDLFHVRPFGRPGAGFQLWLGIEELGKAWIVLHALEIGVGASLEPVAGVALDGSGEMFEAFLDLTGDGIQDGEAVERVVGGGEGVQNFDELLARFLEVIHVQEGNGVIVALFRRIEDQLGLAQFAVAGCDVDAAAFGERGRGSAQQLFKSDEGPFELGLLQQLQGSLIVLE